MVKEAIATLREAFEGDPELAYVWYCNVSCPIFLMLGANGELSDKAASRVMKHLFDVDIGKEYLSIIEKFK